MSFKTDKLSKTIENLQLFLSSNSEQSQEIVNVARQLNKLNQVLTKAKLKVQIVSQKPDLAKATFNLIESQPELKQVFRLKVGGISSKSEQTRVKECCTLIVKGNRRNGTNLLQCVELSQERKYSVGRDPESDLTFDGKIYQGISRNHAAILPVVERERKTKWQICDRNSTNGTFVNGQRVKDAQLLNSGDVVTLAYPQTGENVAEFAFQVPVSAGNPTEGNHQSLDVVDGDLLMIVIDGRQQLSLTEKDFIKYLDRTYIAQQFLLVDLPDVKQEPQLAQNIESNLNSIKSWLNNDLKEQDFQLVPLYLTPFYLEDYRGQVDFKLQKKQEQFIKTLSNIIKRQTENILVQTIAAKVISTVAPIEPLLARQQQKLADKLAQEEHKLESLSQINLKAVNKNAIAEANQSKDRFFKQTKQEINQSKAAFLDVYNKKSISCKVKNFVDNLTPVLSVRNGKKVVRLNDDSRQNSDDINLSAIDFCTDILQKWATAECYKVNHVYGNGGLEALLRRLKEKTNINSDNNSESLYSLKKINVQEIFAISFAGTSCETSYKQKSIGTYLVKQLRSQMMQILLAISVVSGLVGARLNRKDIMQVLSTYFKQYPWLFGLFIGGAIFFLITTYNNENDLKLDEAGSKLKKDLSSYYQSFGKNLLDKVVQEINLNLDLEDKKILDGLKVVDLEYSDRNLAIEQQKNQIKQNIEQYKAQQKSWKTELKELEKLKQM